MYPGVGKSSPEIYPHWATVTVKELRTKIAGGATWSEVLALAAERRRELAFAVPDPSGASPWAFGRRRNNWGIQHHVGYSRVSTASQRDTQSTLRSELADLALDLAEPNTMLSPLPGSQFVRQLRTRYIGRDGKALSVTDVYIELEGPNHGAVSVMQGFSKTIEPILQDVYARIDHAKTIVDPAERRREIYAAIYGYYQACPFDRGTAAIGNVYWAAVGTEVLGARLVLPDGADVRAMVLDQAAFVRWLEGVH